MVGPDYRVPEHALINAPSARGSFVERLDPSLSSAPLPADWWRLYSDPKLDALVSQALTANTNLRIADANLERSRALLREAKAFRQPSIAIDASVERAQLSGEQYLQRFTPPPSNYYDTEITVGYDLDLFGGIRRGIEAAAADDAAVEAARDLVRVNVAAETARAYAGACSFGMQLATARRSLDLQRKSYDLTEELARK
jgi:outer membrane protein TolC